MAPWGSQPRPRRNGTTAPSYTNRCSAPTLRETVSRVEDRAGGISSKKLTGPGAPGTWSTSASVHWSWVRAAAAVQRGAGRQAKPAAIDRGSRNRAAGSVNVFGGPTVECSALCARYDDQKGA